MHSSGARFRKGCRTCVFEGKAAVLSGRAEKGSNCGGNVLQQGLLSSLWPGPFGEKRAFRVVCAAPEPFRSVCFRSMMKEAGAFLCRTFSGRVLFRNLGSPGTFCPVVRHKKSPSSERACRARSRSVSPGRAFGELPLFRGEEREEEKISASWRAATG